MTDLTATLDRVFHNIDRRMEEELQSICALVQIDSVKAAPAGEAAPFGAGARQALTAALTLAERLGLTAKDLQGYIGAADYGSGSEMLAVLAHLDVVPAGPGWTVPPFSATRKDGRIYGRGAMDDKGPAVCALYALSAIREAGVALPKTVRVLLGCDEEQGWGCIEHYKQSGEPLPDMAFSPDGHYPVVFAERGICQGYFTAKWTDKWSGLAIACGERANVVPGVAEAWLPRDMEPVPVPDGFTVETEYVADATHITVHGTGAHASTPEQGKNALLCLLQLLNAQPLEAMEQKMISALATALRYDNHGEQFDLDCADESGRLTLSCGVLHMDEAGVRLAIDVRHPLCLSKEAVLEKLSAVLMPAGFALERAEGQPGLLADKNGVLVKTLLDIYRRHSGDEKAEPLAIGGGTYARAFTNAVAFGCEREGDPMLAHMPDEYITEADVAFHTKVIAEAILRLCYTA
ncbi:MAG: Sapep family Mn(2+)-dependent dipeptidase [Eubacteriales bacterium]|nr:Sapep family Mn(2+)-dependent dipeptidase [Eubacteriales bacterium]